MSVDDNFINIPLPPAQTLNTNSSQKAGAIVTKGGDPLEYSNKNKSSKWLFRNKLWLMTVFCILLLIFIAFIYLCRLRTNNDKFDAAYAIVSDMSYLKPLRHRAENIRNQDHIREESFKDKHSDNEDSEEVDTKNIRMGIN